MPSGPDEESGNSSGIQENLLASSICYMGGVIKVKDVAKFKKLLIRTTRAQTLVHDFDMLLPATEKIVNDDYDMNKKVLIMAFRDGTNIKDKLSRVFGSFEDAMFIDIDPNTLAEKKNSCNLHKTETKNIIV